MDVLNESILFRSRGTTTSLTTLLMYLLSSSLLLGATALQTVLGRPEVDQRDYMLQRTVDDFIDFETPIALEQLFCNIGSSGCHAAGVSPGVVIASPSKHDPDYFFSWTRDSALVFKTLIDRFTDAYDYDLQTLIQQYVVAQAKLQGVSNPSGHLSDGSGLGEPKFKVNLRPFTQNWGRPQRDGPPLRAIAMIGYAKWLINNGHSSTASNVLWPIISNDLSYVTQYWNRTGFDLWEEVHGSSFFTVASQYRALVEGTAVAQQLGKSSNSYTAIAPHVLCFLQNFWIPSQGYIDANINTNDGRTGKDVNTILASIHNFDPALACDDATFQPCSPKALSNLKQVVDSFRFYTINDNTLSGKSVAIGRYSEDVYYNGNPWYLSTLAVAEQLYDALYVWQKQGFITVSDTSLPFFNDLSSTISTGTYDIDSATYKTLVDVVSNYADGFVDIVSRYAGTNGSLAEQFSNTDGTPLSAADLTWSYASFLTAAARRAGVVPPSWANDAMRSVPGTCRATSVAGSYTSATVTSFPNTLTPITGTYTIPSATETKPAPTAPDCAADAKVSVTFETLATTEWGDTIKIVGSIDALGNWNTNNAVALDPWEYTNDDPLWQITIPLPAGQYFEYKYINVKADGTLIWESDPNRRYFVPQTCEVTLTEKDEWQF